HHLLGAIDAGSRLCGKVRGAEGNLNQGTLSVATEQALADEEVAVGVDAANLKVGLPVPKAVQRGDHPVHEGEVGLVERPVLSLDGEDDPAGINVLGKGLFEQPVAADTIAAAGKEADVVVLGTVLPAGSEQREGDSRDQPGCADYPRVSGCEAAEEVKHALCLPVAERRCERAK